MDNKEKLVQINFQLEEKQKELRQKFVDFQPASFVLNKDIDNLMAEIHSLQEQKEKLEAEEK